MNIVLIGYRGTGKSCVARRLAELSKWPVFSTDAEIVKKAGMSVPDIIRKRSWDYFRDVESEICKQAGKKDRTIIDTGGGAVLRKENVESLRQRGRIFWLAAEVSTIMERIKASKERPSLTSKKSYVEEVEEVLNERLPLYKAAADHIILTDGRTIDEIANEIRGLMSPSASVSPESPP
jgi:shikimate kinase